MALNWGKFGPPESQLTGVLEGESPDHACWVIKHYGSVLNDNAFFWKSIMTRP